MFGWVHSSVFPLSFSSVEEQSNFKHVLGDVTDKVFRGALTRTALAPHSQCSIIKRRSIAS